MNWKLDTPVHAGGVACVPVVYSCVSAHGDTGHVAGHGRKQPVLILVFQEDCVTGIDLTGRVYDVEEIESRFPQVIGMATARLEGDAT